MTWIKKTSGNSGGSSVSDTTITNVADRLNYIVQERDIQYLKSLLKTEVGIRYAILGDSTEVGYHSNLSAFNLFGISLITSDEGFIKLDPNKFTITSVDSQHPLKYTFLKKSNNINVSFTVTQRAYTKRTKFTVYYYLQLNYNRAAQFDVIIDGTTYTIDTFSSSVAGITKATFPAPQKESFIVTINNLRASNFADVTQPDFYCELSGFALGEGVVYKNLAQASMTLLDTTENVSLGVSTSQKLQDAYNMNANIISMGWGTNDSKDPSGTNMAAFRTGLEQRIDEIRAYNPNTVILLNNDPLGLGSNYVNNYLTNQIIREVAQEKEVNLLDVETLYKKFDSTLLYYDYVHPNTMGDTITGEVLANMFRINFAYKDYIETV